VIITQQPVSQSICLSGTVTFAVMATGNPVAYQWRWNGVDLVDGSGVSGSTTPTLTLSNITSACVNIPANSSAGVAWGNVTAGQMYAYEAAGCAGIDESEDVTDPDGRDYVANCGGPYSTATASSDFTCPGLSAWSLVGKLGNTCIQLGSSGFIVAPESGVLTLYMNDDVYGDNYGSWNACLSNGGGEYDVVVTGTCGSQTSSVATLTIAQPVAAPAALTAAVSSSNQISLAWGTVEAVDGINIERAPDVSGSPGIWAQIGTVGATVTNYIDTGATTNTTYWYQVLSFNICGDSTNSNQVVVDVAPPAAPSNLDGVAVATNQINLSWTGNSIWEGGFTIERAPDVSGSPGMWAQIDTVGPNTTTYSDTNVPPYEGYWYQVQAYNGLGSSPDSNPVFVNIIPLAPFEVAATPISGTQIRVNWGELSKDQDGFAVDHAPDAGGVPGTWTQLAVANNPGLSVYTDSGLPLGATYWYRVQAFNSVGYSAYSSLVHASTYSFPAAPSNLTATSSPNGVSIALTWINNATNATGNILQRALDNGGVPGTWSQLASLGTNVASFTDYSGATGTIYWYNIRAHNSLGYSPYSNFACAATWGSPPAPTILSAVAMASNRVDVTWQNNSGVVSGYRVLRNGSQIASVNSNVTSYSDFGVTTNKTYSYQVQAFNSYGSSALSTSVSVSIPALPAAPSRLTAAAVATNQINLVWIDNSNNEGGFKIERALDNVGSPGTWGQINVVSTNVTTYSDVGLAGTTRYWYRVRATNTSGDSPYSNLANASTASGTNVWINPLSDKWEVGPNWSQGVPSSAQLGLLITNPTSTTVAIDATTAASNAVNQCLTVGNLTVFSPAGSTNVLSLANSGPTNPLHVVNSLIVTNGGAISITNAVLQVDSAFALDGALALQPDGRLSASNSTMCVGAVSTGQVTITGGSASLGTLIVASNTESVGTLSMDGGSMACSHFFFGDSTNSTAAIWLNGGELDATNASPGYDFGSDIAEFGNAQVIVSNAATLRSRFVFVAGGNGTRGASAGTLTVAGGTAVIDNLQIGFNSFSNASPSVGTVVVSGGTLLATNGVSVSAGNALGQMNIWGGNVLVGGFSVGGGGTGTLTMYGGTLSTPATNASSWFVGGYQSQGFVWINGGTITASNSPLWLAQQGPGQWILTNGSVTVGSLYQGIVQGSGTLTIAGGSFSVVSNSIVGYFGGTGSVWVTGGQFLAPNAPFAIGGYSLGSVSVSGGTAVIRSMIISSNNYANGSALTVAGGQVTVFDSLVVGNCASNAIGQIAVSGGTLYVTNATHTGYLDLRDGTLTVSAGGGLVADVLVMTNTCGLFVHNGGTVSIGSTVIATNLSTVGDGIPDAWRAEYFPGVDPTGRTTNNVSCATCDPDGDGMNNLQEYLAGTVPTDASSALRITAIAPVGADMWVWFASVGGKYYSLERCDFVGGAWTDLVTNVPGNGGVQWVKDIGGALRGGAFYRIALEELSSAPPVDSDGDGVPDLWTEEYFGHPTGQTNDQSLASDDPDGSGFTVLEDYLVGVDPTNAAAAFRITSILPTGNDLLVTWAMGPGRTNALQATVGGGFGDYSTQGFADIFTVTNTVGTTTNYLDIGGATNIPARYYRVRLVK